MDTAVSYLSNSHDWSSVFNGNFCFAMKLTIIEKAKGPREKIRRQGQDTGMRQGRF